MPAEGAGGNIDEFDNQLSDPNQYDNPQDPASLSAVEHLLALSFRGNLTLLYIVAVLIYVLVKTDSVRVLHVAALLVAVSMIISYQFGSLGGVEILI